MPNTARRGFRALVAIGLCALAACGGGGGGGNDGGSFETATSASFWPTTAKDKSTQTKNVRLRWVYAVNGGQPVSTSYAGLEMSVGVSPIEVVLDPAGLERVLSARGTVSGTFEGVGFSGEVSIGGSEAQQVVDGKTLINAESIDVALTVTADGESGEARLQYESYDYTPAQEWFLDRTDLDQLPIGYSTSTASTAKSDLAFTATDDDPISQTGTPISISNRWTVLEKMASLQVQGKTYVNVVKVARQTTVVDFGGNPVPATVHYWVAKGVGMIRGQNTVQILNAGDVVIELTDTNLAP